jgi:hypothetical protein
MVGDSTCPAGSLWDSFHLWDFYQQVAMDNDGLRFYLSSGKPMGQLSPMEFYERVAMV